MAFNKCSCGRWTNFNTTCIKCSKSPLDWDVSTDEETTEAYYDEYKPHPEETEPTDGDDEDV